MIPFPKLHIAESVLNRIHNALNDEPGLAIEMPAPITPDPIAQGVKLDEETAAPIEPVDVAPELQPVAQQGMLESSVTGGSPLDGALLA